MAGGYIDAHRKRANEQTNFQPAIDIMIELVQTSPIRRVRWNAAYGLALDRSHWTFTPNQQAKLREVASKERDEGIHELLREALGEIPRR
jgi:hypothetical protein